VNYLLSIVGWDSLTPQGIRFGIATLLAIVTLTPNRTSRLEIVDGLIFAIAAGIFVAQAASIGH
jgi:hypothetical protein